MGINVVSVPGATTKINMALLKGLYEFLRIQGDPNECGIYVKEMDPPLGIMDRDGNLFGSGSNRKKLGHCPALARDEVDLRISPDGTVTFCYYPSKGIPIGVFTEGSFLADIVYLEGAKPSVRQAFQMLRTYSWGQILNFAREVEGVKGIAEGIIKNPTSFNPCGTCFHVSSLPPDEFDSLFQAAYDYTQRRKPWNLLRR